MFSRGLPDIVIDSTKGKEISVSGVREFLHISGEDSRIEVPLRDVLLPATFIYAGTATMAIVLWAVKPWLGE